ncbi:MAG TPA: SDR family NAD(P)-dependent oxidoreductase [Bryobacteraceae bacterium]|nr:SDR family NAD(P)-dependent oxidoreductase [Bryobacteraceae bacterium]
MDLQLRDKLAFVSGSTAGIGLTIAKALAAEGAQVVVNGRTEARVSQAVDEIQKSYPSSRILPFAGDLSEPSVADAALRRFDRVDILINNLGAFEPKPFEEITDADWKAIIETNFMSGVRLSRGWLPKMKAAGWGRVIFISSESAVNIPPEMIHYGITKTMQVALARGLAETTAGTGVTINSVLAGPTRSEGVEKFLSDLARARGVSVAAIEKEFFQNVRPSSLLQRFATVDEVAAMVAFVASPLSSATNGAALRADGGVIRSIL